MGFLTKLAAVFGKVKAAVMATTATKIVTATVAVAAVTGGTVGMVQADVFTSPEAAVEEALVAMSETEPPAYEEVFGLTALLAAMQESGVEAGVSLDLKDVDASELGLGDITLPSVGFDVKYRGDFANKAHDALVDLKVANTTILSANAYADDKQVQIAVPKLFEAVLGVNYGDSDFLTKLKESYLLEMAEIAPEDLDALVNGPLSGMDMTAILEATKELQEKMLSLQTASFEELEYEKAGKEEIEAYNDETVKCKVYTADIPKEYIEKQIDVMADEMLNYLHAFFDAVGLEEMGLDMSEYDEMFAELDTTLDTELDKFFAPMENIRMTYYIYKDRIVKLKITWTLGEATAEGENTDTAPTEDVTAEAESEAVAQEGLLEIIYPMEGCITDNFEYYMVLPIEGEETQEMHYVFSTTNTEEVYETGYTATLGEGQEVMLKFTYEKLGGDFDVLVSVTDEEVDLDIELTGAIGELEPGKSIGFELDTLKMVAGDVNEELEIGFSMYAKVLDGTIAPLSQETTDVLTMSENDWTNLVMEAVFSVYSMINEFGEMFN